MPCYQVDNLTICRTTLERKKIGRTRKKWCFKCRNRFVHDKVVLTEKLEYDKAGNLINGYYEPELKYECRNCKDEHFVFGT